MKKIIIVTTKPWNLRNAKKLKQIIQERVYIISSKEKFDYQRIVKINPDYIFFPHWSWKVPKEIYRNFECVIFHMTDLPFGRGGSPLQNLISRGINKTKISALRANYGIDAGPIYIKKSLSLNGDAQRIFERASDIIFMKMIPAIIKRKLSTKEQKGKVVKFKRRKPSQSNIGRLNTIKKIYDYIRMLDAKTYPRAFIQTKKMKLEFFDVKLYKGYVLAKTKIEVKSER